jgi:hypothetical protein
MWHRLAIAVFTVFTLILRMTVAVLDGIHRML